MPAKYYVDVMTVDHLTSTRRYCEISGTNAECNIDLPTTAIDVSIRAQNGPFKPVGIHVTGPVSPTDSEMVGFVTPQEARSFRLVGLEYGTYSIVASSPEGLTSVEPLVTTLTPDESIASGNLVLADRRLTIQVADSDGRLLEDASVRTGAFALSRDGAAFDGRRVPAGVPVIVQAPGYLPTCQLAPRSEMMRVVLGRRSSNRTEFALAPDPGRPLGFIEGVPGSECDVDVRSFRLSQSRGSPANERRFSLVGLPPGTYGFKATMWASRVTFTVPARGPLAYKVPEGCLFCKRE
jgi:hypothetical protein